MSAAPSSAAPGRGAGSSSGAMINRKRAPPPSLPLQSEKQVKKSFQGFKPDIKLSRKLKRAIRVEEKANVELQQRDAVLNPDNSAGCLEADPEVFGEKTLKIRQREILDAVDVGTQAKQLELSLPFGEYMSSYTPSGRFVVLGGKKGHVSMLDTQGLSSLCELKLKEQVRCVQALHNENLFAVSQKQCVYVYDGLSGVELHKMKEHTLVHQMEFLPYHFLLVTGSEFGDLRYQDVSTGKLVSHLRTKKGPIRCMRQNPKTAVMNVGHANGVVSMWTPTLKEPCMKMLTHKGSVEHLGFYRENYMVTSGADGKWKIFDLRKPAEPLLSQSCYGSPVTTLSVSQTGLLALGSSKKVQVYDSKIWNSMPEMLASSSLLPSAQNMSASAKKKQKKLLRQSAPNLPALTASKLNAEPYMQQDFPGRVVCDLQFQPFQDVLSVGLSTGISQILCPGAGHSFYDSYGANPYQTKNQKREREVHMLLDKLPYDMIVFNPAFGDAKSKHMVGNFRKNTHGGEKGEDADEELKKSSSSAASGGPGAASSAPKNWLGSHELDKEGKILNVEMKNVEAGCPEEDKDSEEEFEQTGIRMTRGKKKMRGRNKIGKRLKKKEVEKAEEKRTAKKKVKGYNPIDKTVDVAAEGALARFKKKKRRMEELD
eukprot:g15976.t1